MTVSEVTGAEQVAAQCRDAQCKLSRSRCNEVTDAIWRWVTVSEVTDAEQVAAQCRDAQCKLSRRCNEVTGAIWRWVTVSEVTDAEQVAAQCRDAQCAYRTTGTAACGRGKERYGFDCGMWL